MKHKLFFVVVMVIILVSSFFFLSSKSRVSASKIEIIPVATVKRGKSPGTVELQGPYQDMFYEGPGTFDVDIHGNIYIVDQVNHRILEINKNTVVKTIDIKEISNGDIMPKRLIAKNNFMYLLFSNTSGTEYSLALIKNDGVKVINLKKFFGKMYVTGFRMERLAFGKVVIIPDAPMNNPKPVAVIADSSGNIKPVVKMINGTYDGITPRVKVSDKGIEIFNPHCPKPLRCNCLGNLKNLEVPLAKINPIRGAIHYFDENREKGGTITSYILYFDPMLKHIEKCIMVVRRNEIENLLPPVFGIGETEILGADGFLYDMNYTKSGCVISKFVPSN